MTSLGHITVLIPCHSLEYLETSVKSISSQTISEDSFEILLVADRIDRVEAARILGSFSIKHTIIESHIPGIVPALNLGLKHVNTQYVARMDEDDIMIPSRLEVQLRHLEENQKVLAVGGQLEFIDSEGNSIGKARYKKKIRLNEADILKNSPLAHPATMFRLESVRSVGGYRDFLPEDWDLWIRLRELGQIENLRATVLKYRIHSKQLSREKMYAQNLAKMYVATSYFARKAKISDHPHSEETPSEWLQNTQKHLRIISKAYIKFEKDNKKIETINSILELKTTGEKIYTTLQVGQQFPLALLQFILSKLLAKFRQIFL
jgi:glycosyltransferase involved in cell wall biosynthesis